MQAGPYILLLMTMTGSRYSGWKTGNQRPHLKVKTRPAHSSQNSETRNNRNKQVQDYYIGPSLKWYNRKVQFLQHVNWPNDYPNYCPTHGHLFYTDTCLLTRLSGHKKLCEMSMNQPLEMCHRSRNVNGKHTLITVFTKINMFVFFTLMQQIYEGKYTAKY